MAPQFIIPMQYLYRLCYKCRHSKERERESFNCPVGYDGSQMAPGCSLQTFLRSARDDS